MKKLFFLFISLFLFYSPVYAGGLAAPEHIVMQTAKCDSNVTENYVMLGWDNVIGATSYDIYGKPVSGNGDYILYGNTSTPQYGISIKKNVDYYFYVVAKSEGIVSIKSKEYLVNTPAVELSCRTAKENKPWYEMKITSAINDSYELDDWFYANFSFTYSQPEKKFDEKDFVYKAFLYPAEDITARYFELTIKGYQEKRVVYHLNNIPTGYYRLRIMLEQPMTDLNGNISSPFVDSTNKIYIYGQPKNVTPTAHFVIPTITVMGPSVHVSQPEIQQLKNEINDLKNQVKQTSIQQKTILGELNSLKLTVQNILSNLMKQLTGKPVHK